MPEATDRITTLINELAPAFTAPGLQMEWKGERVSLRDPYFAQLDTLVNMIGAAGLHVEMRVSSAA